MRTLSVMTVAILLIANSSRAEAPAPVATLPALRQQFDRAVNDAMATHAQQASEMPGLYVKAIDALEAEQRRNGDLGAVVALRSERARFLTDSNVVIEVGQAEHPEVLRLKRQFLGQRTRLDGERDDVIVRAAATFTNQLALLKRPLPHDGKADAVLKIETEERAVSHDPRVLAAVLGLSASREAPASGPPSKPVRLAEPDAGTGDPALLIEKPIVSFSFSDRELASSSILPRLRRLCMDQGVTLSFASRRIETRPGKAETGIPRFVSGFRPVVPASARPRTYALNDIPLRAVLQTFCVMAGLGYTIDRDLKAVVLMDAEDPGTAWSPDPLPAAQIPKALGTFESRRRHIGRTTLVEGEAATAVQGIADYIITLKDGVRVCLPQTPASRARFDQVRNALGTDSPHAVQLTALGVIRPESSAQGLTVGGAVLLEVSTGLPYSISPVHTPLTPLERPIHRIGE